MKRMKMENILRRRETRAKCPSINRPSGAALLGPMFIIESDHTMSAVAIMDTIRAAGDSEQQPPISLRGVTFLHQRVACRSLRRGFRAARMVICDAAGNFAPRPTAGLPQ